MLVVGQMMHKKHPSHFTEPQKLWEFTSFLRAVGSVSVCLWSDVSGGQLILFVVLIKTQCNTVDWETKKKMQQQQMRGQNPHWGNPSENNMFFQVVCFMSTEWVSFKVQANIQLEKDEGFVFFIIIIVSVVVCQWTRDYWVITLLSEYCDDCDPAAIKLQHSITVLSSPDLHTSSLIHSSACCVPGMLI